MKEPAVLLPIASIILLVLDHIWAITVIFLAIMRGHGRTTPDWVHLIARSLKWVAFSNIFAQPVFTIILDGHLGGRDYVAIFINGLFWWVYRDEGDDDSSKRAKRKIHEKVQQVGGKLVIVPEPA